jgi:hypothetical protein
MAVTKVSYSTLPVITPVYIKVELDTSESDLIIITDIINNNEPGNIHVEASGDEIWLKVASNNQFEVLAEDPTQKEDVPVHTVENLELTQIRLKTSESFFIEYNDPDKNDALHRSAVTGFQMGSGDAIFIKFDTINSVMSVYQEN